MEDCLFCRIIKGDIPAKKVFEDDRVVVIEDIGPKAPVHLLVIPRRHFVNSLDMEPGDCDVVGHVFEVAAAIARDKGFADKGFRIVNNNNAGAGQSVFHIHFHLLAGREFNWPPG
ncbi:putative HIT-like protein aq_141 [Geobacter sp. OR-1]|uniref:histidine triad nucleotide-binding protein n=1 Tax=Geobacter sp. OR-1 TaxID=1266765 RepID=UPI0005439897|nr:histidine triad nucleotide-binding protein [Geobacter sp. OR-1]GAM10639.1 putative HIT-like protein aq_141 [Geobacter sp. OR-1]